MEQGLSLREVARRADVEPAHLSRIERGLANPSIITLVRLARVLHLQASVDQLDQLLQLPSTDTSVE
jgi:transcriptional regulator with XRE-family HTH domain